MVPDHGTQYEESPPSYHGGMHDDGHQYRLMEWLTDGRTDMTLFTIFPDILCKKQTFLFHKIYSSYLALISNYKLEQHCPALQIVAK